MTPDVIESVLSSYPQQFRRASIDAAALAEARKRVLDTLACFYGAFEAKPGKLIRNTFLSRTIGDVAVWGTNQRGPAELAAWANGTCVRTLDYNDTYLSKEPCHPSDLIAPLWAACELSGARHQGDTLLRAIVLSYEVMCRLCDANSLRVRGWDHVTYLPIASAIGCSYIYRLNPVQTRHAIALAVIGNNAMRQTRVGDISDWKAACAAYAARAGLAAVRLAAAGFTGPSDIFAGKHGFFNQVSGAFDLPKKKLGSPWKIMDTHTKFFPAEHHAQSAIEAAIQIRRGTKGEGIKSITIETFDVAVSIIGSEKEKWLPATRETADHSMPYLVAVALLDGDVNLSQYERKRFLDPRVRRLMKRVRVKNSAAYSRLYPKKMPTRVTVHLSGGRKLSAEVLLPRGYAGRPMSIGQLREKFHRLSSSLLAEKQREKLVDLVDRLHTVSKLSDVTRLMRTKTR